MAIRDNDPTADQLRAMVDELDHAVRNAQRVRKMAEARMRQRESDIWPDRRRPQRWEQVGDAGDPSKGNDISGSSSNG